MFIALSWMPLYGVTGNAVIADLDHAMPASDFTLVYDAYPGLRLAAVVDANVRHVTDLEQTLVPLSDRRFKFVIAYVPQGHYLAISHGVLRALCDAVAGY